MHKAPLSLLVNPAAARGRSLRRLPRILALLRQAGVDPNVYLSSGPGDLEAEARRLAVAGTPLLVGGGDGSVHEVVNGLRAAAEETDDATAAPTPFGLIPVGTGNDFAKAAGIPLDWQMATRVLASRIAHALPPRRIDAGRMNGRWFANGAGVGFDAAVNRIAVGWRWPLGTAVYLGAVLRALADGVATPRMTITAGDRPEDVVWDAPLTLANIANGPWLGGMFHIAPMADHADGELDLVIAAPVSRRRILGLLPVLVRGAHLDEPEVSHRRVTRLWIEAESPVPSHLDGESQPLAARFEIEVVPRALALL